MIFAWNTTNAVVNERNAHIVAWYEYQIIAMAGRIV